MPQPASVEYHSTLPPQGKQDSRKRPELWSETARSLLPEDVQKLWRWGGKASDRMCMKTRERSFLPSERDLSAAARGNPLDSSHQNTAQACARGCFPPIHNTHHNKKSPNFCFKIVLCCECWCFSEKTVRQSRQRSFPRSRAIGISTARGVFGVLAYLWPLYFAEKRVQYANGTDTWEKPCPQQEPYARKVKRWNSA